MSKLRSGGLRSEFKAIRAVEKAIRTDLSAQHLHSSLILLGNPSNRQLFNGISGYHI
ncbi:MAG: hypothetical protein JSW26_18675 [Desulfobacterales bacterium]|nr:MAG: hypothetical protein JSW26_18675 [Desulfobacterales bacterium]